MLSSARDKATESVKRQADGAKQTAAHAATVARAKASEAKSSAMTMAEAKALGASEALVKYIMGHVTKVVRKAVVDPDMPGPVARAVEGTVNVLMDDLTLEVQEVALGTVRKREVPPLKPWPGNCLVSGLARMRAFFLYTLFPADQSVWRQMKNPAWWLLKAVSIFPYYGVQQGFFTVHFLLMNKRDEFQLVNFVLLFKGSQFVSVGFVSTIIGSSIYYAAQGDGTEPVFPASFASAALFAWQILLVWAAAALLPCSRSWRVTSEVAEKKIPHGGRLLPFVVWDTFAFLISAALVVAVIVAGQSEARIVETIFWARAIYALLSLPFFFFAMAGALFTHATPTGYDEHGACVPLLTPTQVAKRREKAEEDAAEGAIAVAVRSS